MVVVQKETQTSSALNTTPLKGGLKGSLSFSDLLHGASVQNGAMALALDDAKEAIKSVNGLTVTKDEKSSKAETLSSLLKTDEKTTQTTQTAPYTLNTQVTQKLSPAELKVLIKEAKEYLKNKITASEAFSKSEISALPNTLKGLLQVAKKLAIDVSKITLEELKGSVKSSSKDDVLKSVATQQEPKQTEETSALKSTKTDKELRVASNAQSLEQKDVKEKNIQVQQNAKAQDVDLQTQTRETQKSDPKTLATKASETPLFKAQTKTEISTQEIVSAKATAVELRKPKERAEDTLKLLLRGEKPLKSETGMTADFSVATARVLAPQTTTKTLESLLQSSLQEGNSQSKLDGLNLTKADSFDVKINEAKQMVKYISQDVKTAIEDYKSPFTRVKVQLNPQRLGEIDLTVVQRGKNLHVTLSSNNAAINTLAMNANDLRVQLTNNGIQNASLNFSNNSQSQDGSAGQQQQSNHQQRENAHDEYNYFEKEEVNEEILSSLEIVVPSYA